MIESLERITDLLLHPYAVALLSLLIGCYILRDIVRVFFFIFDGSRRAARRRGKGRDDEDRPPAPAAADGGTDAGG